MIERLWCYRHRKINLILFFIHSQNFPEIEMLVKLNSFKDIFITRMLKINDPEEKIGKMIFAKIFSSGENQKLIYCKILRIKNNLRLSLLNYQIILM